MHTLVYKRANNCLLRADVFLPLASRPPVVLYIHGGALISGSRKYLASWQIKQLNQAGFAVVSIDYRLAPETRLSEIVKDVQDAIVWVKGEGASITGWDATRVSLMGSSAGGYLSLLAGTLDAGLMSIISFYGYGDILGDWYTRPSEFYLQRPLISKEEAENAVGGREKSTGGNSRYVYYCYCRQQGIWPEAVSGCHPVRDRQALLRYCPVERVTSGFPPTLLLHGDCDTDVPYEQSLAMSRVLEKQGIKNQLITVEGAGHGFDREGDDPGVRELFQHVVNFLQEHNR